MRFGEAHERQHIGFGAIHQRSELRELVAQLISGVGSIKVATPTRYHLEGALIAATALVRGLNVVTRNVDDFKPFSVPTINPFTKRSAG